jgi:hypothetical protein
MYDTYHDAPEHCHLVGDSVARRRDMSLLPREQVYQVEVLIWTYKTCSSPLPSGQSQTIVHFYPLHSLEAVFSNLRDFGALNGMIKHRPVVSTVGSQPT